MRHRAGISFVEILFAVMILGIGFLLIAGSLPVAIKQQELTVNASVTTAISKNAMRILDTYAPKEISPGVHFFAPTGGTVSRLTDEQWSVIAGNMIYSANPRYAWTILYSRDASQQIATAYIFTLRSTTSAEFTPQQLVRRTFGITTFPSDIEAKPIEIDLVPATGAIPVDHIVIRDRGIPDARFAVTDGARIITTDGRIFEVAFDGEYDVWTPSLAQDQIAALDSNIPAFIVGRSYRDFLNSNQEYDGHAQSIGLTVTDIMIPAGF